MKTPVTILKANAQLLAQRFRREGDASAVEVLVTMDVQLNKLTRLIGDLFDDAKVKGGEGGEGGEVVTSVRDALTYGPKQPQAPYPPGSEGFPPELAVPGEDCLNLNIWSPDLGSARLPVMVWIHGGAFELGTGATAVGNVSLLVLLAAGVAAGFMGGWWGRGWIWAALGLLVLISFAMNGAGSRPLIRVRQRLGEAKHQGPKGDQKISPAIPTDQQLAVALAAVNPWLLTVIGGGGLALILWLMMFKPF